ncbi:aminotransferase class III-fold pyridoxal phosphate-dependent enzyme [Nocardiopsis rhodophaea]
MQGVELTTNPDTASSDLAEPYLGSLLTSLGLDIYYHRSQKDTLYHYNKESQEVPVLDFVGGYGSTVLGHNHPDLVEYAKQLLDNETAIHAQFSKHPYANDLTQNINSVIRREFTTTDEYSAIFANSGAEAVEVAVKHAEMDRITKATELLERVAENRTKARSAIADGALIAFDDPYDRLASATGLPLDATPDEFMAEAERVNGERAAAPPVLLALEGSFHGKLIGSVQLTHNAGFRTPFTSLATQCRFLPTDDTDTLVSVIENERKVVFDFVVEGGAVRVVERDLPVIAALIIEPVQGEAGIRPLGEETAQRIQKMCTAVGCPIIIDEVQSGMGRTGAFFASSRLGLQGDYYTLAKSLGGGIAKAAMTLISKARYRDEFELVHSSTFAKDAFSTLIACRTVDLLEADGGAAYRLAEARGERLLSMLRRLRDDFPTVIDDVRGVGLMVGIEFRDQSGSPAGFIAEQARSGLLGYALAGYLLRQHSLRVLPTASATNTLRLEPSVYITDDEISQLEAGLRGLALALRDNDGTALLP